VDVEEIEEVTEEEGEEVLEVEEVTEEAAEAAVVEEAEPLPKQKPSLSHIDTKEFSLPEEKKTYSLLETWFSEKVFTVRRESPLKKKLEM
jgi:hypothetical protein